MTNVLFSVMQSQSPVVIGIGSGASGSKPDLEKSLTESEWVRLSILSNLETNFFFFLISNGVASSQSNLENTTHSSQYISVNRRALATRWWCHRYQMDNPASQSPPPWLGPISFRSFWSGTKSTLGFPSPTCQEKTGLLLVDCWGLAQLPYKPVCVCVWVWVCMCVFLSMPVVLQGAAEWYKVVMKGWVWNGWDVFFLT